MNVFSEKEVIAALTSSDENAIRSRLASENYRNKSPKNAALLVASLLLYPLQPVAPPRAKERLVLTEADRWREEMLTMKRFGRAAMIENWINGVSGLPAGFSAYPMFLYNFDYGDTRLILRTLMSHEKHAPPYLAVLMVNMFRQILGLTPSQIKAIIRESSAYAEAYKDLFKTSEHVTQWLKRKRQTLRFYAGATNTVLGMYDGHFADPQTGAAALNPDAQGFYDLGGGFSTSEINRLTGKRYVSADVLSPIIRNYDEQLIFQRRSSNDPPTVTDDEQTEEHYHRQDEIIYLPFDVLRDSFPLNYESYAIVSTGFMTSTVRSLEDLLPESAQFRLNSFILSFYSILRVMELVCAGKEVDLFTIQRATARNYKYKTCFLQWRRGHLTKLMTTDGPIPARHRGVHREWTDQNNSFFRNLT